MAYNSTIVKSAATKHMDGRKHKAALAALFRKLVRNRALLIAVSSGVVLMLLLVGAVWWILNLGGELAISSRQSTASDGLVGTFEGSYVDAIKQDSLIKLTNEERVKAGLGEVTLNDSLSESAAAKCKDMVDKNYWAHVSPAGTQPWYFFDSVGYSYEKAGENLAYGFATSAGLMRGWMNSPTHKANVLGEFTEVGFGICEGSNYIGSGHQTVVVQHLGAPQAASPAPAPVHTPKPYVPYTCTKTPIPYQTKYVEASYLYEGETQEYGGVDGYLHQCTADSTGYRPEDFTLQPYDKTIYVGTMPRPVTP